MCEALLKAATGLPMGNGRRANLGTISRALTLSDVRSRCHVDPGSADVAKARGHDKATTRRFFDELEKHGYDAQPAQIRRYRLGAATLRLTCFGEASCPYPSTANPVAQELVQATGETVHLSKFSAGYLSTTYVKESPKAHLVIVNVGTILPPAFGLAYLAASSAEMIETTLIAPLNGCTDPTGLRRRVTEAQVQGYSINRKGIEAGVVSASAAIVGPSAQPIGCITVAAPFVRTGEERIAQHGGGVRAAAAKISEAFFGTDREVRSSL